MICYICIFFRSNRKRKPSPERTVSGSYQQSKDDQPSWSLAENAKIHTSKILDFYGKTEDIRKKIISAFKGYFSNLEETQIHKFYIWKFSKCHGMCSEDRTTMTKDKKFQYKSIFNENLAYQERSESLSNQAFEGVKFMTIVNSSDIFGISFLTSNFLFWRMSYRKYCFRWSIKHVRPSFGQEDIHNKI